MEKVILSLSGPALQTLVLILAASDFKDIPDFSDRMMIKHIILPLFMRLQRRSINDNMMVTKRKKKHKVELSFGEAIALYWLIAYTKVPVSDYSNSVIYDIRTTIESKITDL